MHLRERRHIFPVQGFDQLLQLIEEGRGVRVGGTYVRKVDRQGGQEGGGRYVGAARWEWAGW